MLRWFSQTAMQVLILLNLALFLAAAGAGIYGYLQIRQALRVATATSELLASHAESTLRLAVGAVGTSEALLHRTSEQAASLAREAAEDATREAREAAANAAESVRKVEALIRQVRERVQGLGGLRPL